MRNDEQAMLSAVSTEAPWALIEGFAKMPRWRPEDVNRAADHLAARLRAFGVPVEMHAPELWLSIPLEASVEAGGEIFRAKPPSSAPSLPDGVAGEMVYLGANLANLRSYAKDVRELFGASIGSVAEARARLAGKILLTEGFGNPALTAFAEEWGAIGLIAINPGVDIHWGTCTTIWGTPDLDDLPRKPKIPVAAVSKPSGEKLIALAAQGGRATIRTRLEEGWFVQKIPVVQIPGASEPDRFVLLHGHYDSWDVGVGDNATGDATLLEIARVLWAHRGGLKRSVRIAWWPGHSTGRYAGSTWYSDAFAIDLAANCVAQINCDSPGCRWATSYHQTTCMSEMQVMVAQVIEEVAGAAPKFKRPNQAGDYSFNNIGISSHYMLSSTMPDDLRAEKNYYAVSGCGGNIAWHTENDTLEIADREVLERDIRIYLLSVLRHANADLLPADWRATAGEFLATIERYQEAAGDRFDLTPARKATQKLHAALDRFYAAARDGGLDADRANEVQMRLARILVPVNFTREPRFRHDPAYSCPPLPTLQIAAELAEQPEATLGFARTQLMRGQNRYLAAIDEALTLVEGALR
ncbi:MAG TPA: M28 family peptidase [Geminicoccaceae bacterium]|nr:M28 family peptidase [Geminicoccaceae bacterium]